MNNYFKLFSAFLVTTAISFNGMSQSINDAPDNAIFFVKEGSQVPITPKGCVVGTATFKYSDGVNSNSVNLGIVDGIGEPSFDWTVPTANKLLIGSDSVYVTNGLGNGVLAGNSLYRIYKYSMTCTSSATSLPMASPKHISFVAIKNDINPIGYTGGTGGGLRYIKCGNVSTGQGFQVEINLQNYGNNQVLLKRPNEAVYSTAVLDGYGMNRNEDGQVQTGTYRFKLQFYPYFDSGSNTIISNYSTDKDFESYVTKVQGNPVVVYGRAALGTTFVNLNGTLRTGSGNDVCANDLVKLNWDKWDAINQEFHADYSLSWRKDIQGTYNTGITFGDQNNAQLDMNSDIPNSNGATTYRLYFLPKGIAAQCENNYSDPIAKSSLTSYIDNGGNPIGVVLKKVVAQSISGDSKVCPDGSIDLSVLDNLVYSDYVWKKDANLIVGNSSKVTVTSAGIYSIQYTDNSVKNSLGASCLSPLVSKEITSYNKPVAPSVTSNGKLAYCDYDFKSATLSASTTWNEAAVKSWNWATTSTAVGTSTDNSYLTKGFGTYNVTYTDVNGCVSGSAALVISPIARPATPSIKLTGNAYNCEKNESGVANTVSFDLSSSALAGSPSYAWFNGSSAIAGATTSSLKNYATNGSVSLTQTDLSTGCTSLNSPAIAIKFETNPTFTGASIVKSAYTLTANGFDAANTNDYVWKVGTSALGTSATQKISGTTAAEYSVAQFKSFTLNGSTIKCLSTAAKYSYVPDPEFSGIIAFPNPYNANTTSMFTIDVVDTAIWNGASVSIYDMMGRLVYSSTLSLSSSSAGAKFDLKSLGNGIYVLNLNASSGNTFQTKLVVNK